MRVNATALFLRAIRDDFWAAFQTSEKQVDPRVARCMRTGLKSDKPSEAFGFAQAAPVARFWDKGYGIPSDGFLTYNFQVRSWKFGIGIEISQEDVEDDQTHKIMSRIYESASSFAMLPERHFYYALTNGATTDANQMQPIVPLAPDGGAWFSKTDGAGNARFGVATTARGGGNVVNTSGVGSAMAVITDLFNGLAQVAAYKTGAGQPYWNPGQMMREIVVFYNSLNLLVFQSALNQMFVTSSSGNAAPSNPKIDSNLKVVGVANPRITSNAWYGCATDAPFQAPFWMERVAPTERLDDPSNSSVASEYDYLKFKVRSRGAIGLGVPSAWFASQ